LAVEAMLRQVEDDGRVKFQAYFAIDLPTPNELIIFEGSARDEETFNRSLAMLNEAIPPMLNGLRFISEGGPAPLGGMPRKNRPSARFRGAGRRRRNRRR
jgi:hypothetical protein